MRNLAVVASLTLLLAACLPERKVKAVEQQMKVKGGHEFAISLVSNRSTGYHWTVCNYDPSGVIKIKELTYKQATQEPHKVGVPGQEVFTFTSENIKHQATVYLYFNYVGPGQDGSKPAKTVRYTINVN